MTIAFHSTLCKFNRPKDIQTGKYLKEVARLIKSKFYEVELKEVDYRSFTAKYVPSYDTWMMIKGCRRFGFLKSKLLSQYPGKEHISNIRTLLRLDYCL